MGIVTTISNCQCCNGGKDGRCVCIYGCGYTVWQKQVGLGGDNEWVKTTLSDVCDTCTQSMPSQEIIDQEGCNYTPTDAFGKCCGNCIWEKREFSRAWTKVSTNCKEDCTCASEPTTINCDGYKEEDFVSQGENWKRCYKHCLRPDECCEINPDDPRAVDVSATVLTCLAQYGGDCQYFDMQFKAICCGDCSSSTSSLSSSDSDDACICGCPAMCGNNVTATLKETSLSCTLTDVSVALKYKNGPAPTDNLGLGGIKLADEWWRSDSFSYGGKSGWVVVLYCNTGVYGGNAGDMRLYIESWPGCVNTIQSGSIAQPVFDSTATCSPILLTMATRISINPGCLGSCSADSNFPLNIVITA